MRRLWDVTVTIVEDWGTTAAIAVRRYEVLATSAQDAERTTTEYISREYASAAPETPFRINEIVIGPLMCDMNAVRDGLYPDIRCLDE